MVLMSTTATKGLTTQQAFAEMLNNANVELKDKKVLRFRFNNNKITLDKMIEILKANGYKSVQDQVWIQG